jgi:hypothetical protein
MLLFLQLFLAHIVGDFFFQTDKWIKDKEQKKWRSIFLYVHSLIHFGLIIAITSKLSNWKIALVLACLHFIIDGIKLQFQKPPTKRKWFFIDQGMHIITITIVWYLKESVTFDWNFLSDPKILIFITAVLFLLNPTSFLIKTIISKWIYVSNVSANDSLQNAGQWIGILERLLILTFILIGQWEGVGFLLAAKSIFRFGDLKEAKEMKLTEYVLIGTLLSFSLAIGVALITKSIIEQTHLT